MGNVGAQQRQVQQSRRDVLLPCAVHTMQSYALVLEASHRDAITISLSRGANEDASLDQFRRSISGAQGTAQSKFADDDAFYAGTPVLTGN